jgi:hypothetical protein
MIPAAYAINIDRFGDKRIADDDFLPRASWNQ